MSPLSAPEARVTVVVTTYNRPAALRVALGGLVAQSEHNWQALVIGDHCADSTAAAVAGVADPRIRYINLPERCGEQALPNSVGMALAGTEYVALLNHDDLWLADHLERALRVLDGGGADLLTSRAAFAVTAPEGDDFVIAETSPEGRTLADAFTRPFYYFEPLSSWVFRRAPVLAAAGAMTPAAGLHRTPLEDWLLRAWRAGVRHVDGDTVTVLKDNTATQDGAGHAYDSARIAIGWSLDRMREAGPDAMRAEFAGRMARARAAGITGRDFRTSYTPERRACAEVLTDAAAAHFLATGEDAINAFADAAGFGRGDHLRRSLVYRVGETLAEPPDLERLIAFARVALHG